MSGAVDAVLRFYPGEWMPNLPGVVRLDVVLRGNATPVSNPGHALLTQSKRFPLTWDRAAHAVADLARASARDARPAGRAMAGQ